MYTNNQLNTFVFLAKRRAAKNLDRWNEFHPDAAVVLSAAFSNVDGIEFVEAAPNSGILLAALRALQSERRPPADDRGDDHR